MSAKDARDRIADDAVAQRLLNLAFIFNTSTRPISTDEIVSDSDLGYGSTNRESEVKKFNRDRKKLSEQGIEIIPAPVELGAENETALWMLDRENTFAAGGIVTPDDAALLAEAIDEYLSEQTSPLRTPLMHVRTKVAEVARSPQEPSAAAPASAHQAMLDTIWLAFSLHRTLSFSYTNAHGEASRRSVQIFGIFNHEGATYIVGLDDASHALRTFRTDRMEQALRPGAPYRIPDDFDIHEFLFLPFDFGGEEGIDATFSFPSGRDAHALTHGRGTVSPTPDGSLLWTVRVRNLDAAAAFALEHARDGMRPYTPQVLVDAWENKIREAVEIHETR